MNNPTVTVTFQGDDIHRSEYKDITYDSGTEKFTISLYYKGFVDFYIGGRPQYIHKGYMDYNHLKICRMMAAMVNCVLNYEGDFLKWSLATRVGNPFGQ